ncbi:MAG TPA: permease-like cell division protein FtsX [Candidatus Polarisedimenticolaceae bacterium]|nr:permease-like cell division protein FtsX [Candidatus Polarisedimenticolaceae bacterium]
MKQATWTNCLRYFVADAWDEWRHSRGVNLLALGTLTATLFVAGLMLLLLSNLERQLTVRRDHVQVQVYLYDETTPDARVRIERLVGTMPGVERVDYVDKTEALRRYREWAGQLAPALGELDGNPLPTSLEVTLVAGPAAEEQGEAIVAALVENPVVEEVRFDRDWLRKLAALLDLARVGGGALALLVLAAVVFVMASVLRLAVYARRDEIDIMLLVGATPGFVRGPFLVAGLAQGLVAGALAVAAVETVRRAALAYAGRGSPALVDLVLERALPLPFAGLLIVVGLAVALVSAFFAVRASI